MSEFRRRLMMVGGGGSIPNYLCFTALEDGTFTLNVPSRANLNTFHWVEYSTDECVTWTHVDRPSNTALTVTTPTVENGGKVYWRADFNGSDYNTSIYFSSTGNFNVSGDLESIHTYEGFENIDTISRNATGCATFINCTHLISAENLILKNVTDSSRWSYRQLFEGCTSLTTPPSLALITNVNEARFFSMFKNCSSLLVAPSLSHMNIIGSDVFHDMFRGCSSLTATPPLPTTDTLKSQCFYGMFRDCTSLSSAPQTLPATNLATSCYAYMFYNCTSLTTAPELPATTVVDKCYESMFQTAGIIESPILAAPVLVANCYSSMLRQCPNINKITMLATDISASNCLRFFALWPSQSNGTFVKSAQTTIPYGNDGVPNGWTIVDYQE